MLSLRSPISRRFVVLRHFSAADDSNKTTTTTFRDRARKNLRDRRDRARKNLRERRDKAYESYSKRREDLRHSYDEFKQHPRESAIAGAKSFSGMMRMYGPVFFGTYFSVYLVTLGSFYAGVSSGALDPVQLFSMLGIEQGGAESTVQLVVDFMKNHTFTKPYANWVAHNPQVANLGVAWITVKFTEPIRLPIALFLTPRVAKKLGYGPKTEAVEGDDEDGKGDDPNTTTTTKQDTTKKI